MDIHSRFKNSLDELSLPLNNARVLVAVSGGLDSMVLLRLCRDASLNLGIVHCNFQLRGEESDLDEALARDTASFLGIPFHCRHFNTEEYATVNKLSIQLAARKLRYEFFEEVMKIEGYSYLFTAHHSNDNAETVLHNFLKGTGLPGLHGIPRISGNIIRPITMFSKEELQSFAIANNVKYREDASNASLKYTRNFLRNEILPRLEEYYPNVHSNLNENTRRFRSIENFYRFSVERQLAKLVLKKENELFIPVLKLLSIPGHEALLYEILQPFGFSDGQVQNVLSLTRSQSGKFVRSETHRVFRNRAWLIIAGVKAEESGFIHISMEDAEIEFPGGKLKLSMHDGSRIQDEGQDVAWLDAGKIEFPLLLRKWKTGDYFYPLGLLKPSGKPAQKKVSRFMNDKKMSVLQKEQQWVLESDKRIIWLPGLRADHRFRVSPATQNTLRIELMPK